MRCGRGWIRGCGRPERKVSIRSAYACGYSAWSVHNGLVVETGGEAEYACAYRFEDVRRQPMRSRCLPPPRSAIMKSKFLHGAMSALMVIVIGLGYTPPAAAGSHIFRLASVPANVLYSASTCQQQPPPVNGVPQWPVVYYAAHRKSTRARSVGDPLCPVEWPVVRITSVRAQNLDQRGRDLRVPRIWAADPDVCDCRGAQGGRGRLPDHERELHDSFFLRIGAGFSEHGTGKLDKLGSVSIRRFRLPA
jgi:hypothetical protein